MHVFMMFGKGTLLVFCEHQVQVSASQAKVIAVIKRGLFSAEFSLKSLSTV